MRARLLVAAIVLVHAGVARTEDAPTAQAIVELGQSCLLGGVREHAWIPGSMMGLMWTGPQTLKQVGLGGAGGEITANAVKGGAEPCRDFWTVELAPATGKPPAGAKAPKAAAPSEGVAIGTPSWQPLPRSATVIGAHAAAYRQLVEGILKQNGIARPEVKITQLLRVDLEGDGTDETIVAANRHQGGGSGDYSVLVLRKSVARTLETVILAEEYSSVRRPIPGAPGENRVTAVADLNGDGVMEIVWRGTYAGGTGARVIEVKGPAVRVVLECFCPFTPAR